MAKILVIDDDISLLQLIKNALEYDHSITTYTGLSSVSIREINKHDLLILDVMMPELDGFTFLKEKRREIDIPVLFLTAKSFEQDLIEGFSIGADDYIVKPFSVKELRYRIMAHIRRENRTKSNMIHIGNIFCDFTVRKIYVNEAEINMTSTEYEICSLLMRNPNRVITAMRKQLMIVKSALGKTLLRKSFENCEVALLYPRTHFSDELPISS